jgi:hypothetical protein
MMLIGRMLTSKVVLKSDRLVASENSVEPNVAARKSWESLHLRENIHLHLDSHWEVRAVDVAHHVMFPLQLIPQPLQQRHARAQHGESRGRTHPRACAAGGKWIGRGGSEGRGTSF